MSFLLESKTQRGPSPVRPRHSIPLLALNQTLMSCLLLSVSPLTGKKVKCRKADSRSERSGSRGERREKGGNRRSQG